MGKTVHRLSRSYSVSYQQVINTLGINYVKHVNKCGIICENSEEGLYVSIKKVLLNPDLIEQYSKNCKERAAEFEINKICLNIEKLID